MPNLKTIIVMDNSNFTFPLATNCSNLKNIIIGANLLDSELSATVSSDKLNSGGRGTNTGGSGSKPASIANLAFISTNYTNDITTQVANAKTIISSLNLPSSVLSKLPSNIGGTGAAVTVNTAVTIPSTIKYDSWAKSYIQQAYELGLVNAGSISSNYTSNITRAEFCVLADNLYKQLTGDTRNMSTGEDFTDVKNSTGISSSELLAIRNMTYHGVINGYGDGNFGPWDKLTREQAAVMLSRLASAIGKTMPTASSIPFTDVTSSTWSVNYIKQVYAAGVMNGETSTRFGLKNYYTAEQAIVTMVRLYDYCN
jgi:hypothetical protein